MKQRTSVLVGQIGMAALGALFSGCTLLGLAVDASQQPDTLAVDRTESTLEGKNVLVTLRGGDSFAGECKKVGTLPATLYRARYAQWQEKKVFRCSPDDTVRVAWDHGKLTAGTLEGFTRNAILVLPFRTAPPALQRPRGVLSISAEKIDSVWTLDGTTIIGQRLRAMLQQGDLPSSDGLLVRRAGVSTWVPQDEIAQISEIQYSYEWMNRGVIADAAGLVVALVFFATKEP